MLPAVKNTVVASVTALALAFTAAAPAQALGKNEKNFIAGAATALIINGLIRQDRAIRQLQPRYVQPQYAQPAPVYQPRPTYRTSIYNSAAGMAFNSYSRSERVAIQRQLSRQGYYYSSIDGSFGPGTYNAVAAYARDNGQGQQLASRNGAYAVYDGLLY